MINDILKNDLVILIFLLFLINCFLTEESFSFTQDKIECIDSSQITTDEKELLINQPLKLKRPETAFFWAAIPGFILRGAGHFYIGSYKTGTTLLIISLASWLTILPGSFQLDYPEFILDLAVITFVGSWLYDMIAAPIICKRDNEKKIKSLSINPYSKKDLFGNKIGLKLSYRF